MMMMVMMMMILKPFRLTLKLNGTECIKPLTGERYTNACCDHDDHGHVYNDDGHVYYDDDHVYDDDDDDDHGDHVYDDDDHDDNFYDDHDDDVYDDHDHDHDDNFYDDDDHVMMMMIMLIKMEEKQSMRKGHLNHQLKESDKVVGD